MLFKQVVYSKHLFVFKLAVRREEGGVPGRHIGQKPGGDSVKVSLDSYGLRGVFRIGSVWRQGTGG
jgi:hypothetical protein